MAHELASTAVSRRRMLGILIPVVILCLLISLFFALNVPGVIPRRTQRQVAILTPKDNGQVISAENYRVTGFSDLKSGENGYSFPIGYGEVKGYITTENGEEIEFGFVNPNNWHHVQITIILNSESDGKHVLQSVVFLTDHHWIEVYETESVLDENKYASVFREGV